MKNMLIATAAVAGLGFLPMLWFEFCRQLPIHPVMQVYLILGGVMSALALIARLGVKGEK